MPSIVALAVFTYVEQTSGTFDFGSLLETLKMFNKRAQLTGKHTNKIFWRSTTIKQRQKKSFSGDFRLFATRSSALALRACARVLFAHTFVCNRRVCARLRLTEGNAVFGGHETGRRKKYESRAEDRR